MQACTEKDGTECAWQPCHFVMRDSQVASIDKVQTLRVCDVQSREKKKKQPTFPGGITTHQTMRAGYLVPTPVKKKKKQQKNPDWKEILGVFVSGSFTRSLTRSVAVSITQPSLLALSFRHFLTDGFFSLSGPFSTERVVCKLRLCEEQWRVFDFSLTFIFDLLMTHPAQGWRKKTKKRQHGTALFSQMNFPGLLYFPLRKYYYRLRQKHY